MYSICFRHLIVADSLELEVLYATTNAFSFGRFQLVDICHECPRHTVNGRAHIEVQDGIGYFAVKIESARGASTCPRDGIHRSHWFSPLA